MRLSSVGFYIFALTVIFLAAGSCWLTVEAVRQNVYVAHTTSQILSFIATAEDAAAKDPKFAQNKNEDLIYALWRRGSIEPDATQEPVLRDSWGGVIHATAAESLLMRVEMDLPGQACRRLGLFFYGVSRDLGLQSMEARMQDDNWRQFYDLSDESKTLSEDEVEAACGTSSAMTSLALIIKLKQ